ncbi:MAG: beta-lactamase family protein, partial [Thermoproteota archaeon]|nr:beta-lactamase family protein [Thermoproteota archaeon]
ATHTSALPEWPSNYCSGVPTLAPNQETFQSRLKTINCGKDYTFDQLLQALSNTTLSREPGSKFEYSTFGIALLGHILTIKSNMSSFDKLLAHNILNVLGMKDTSFNPSDSQKSRLAVGHFNGQGLPIWNLSKPIEPGGGLYSTTSDMLKFISSNMGLIKTKLDNSMQESHLIRHSTSFLLPNNLQASVNNDNLGYYVGLGWIINTNFGHEIIWHNGATPGGYNAFMAFNHTTERGIVILCSADIANALINNIMFTPNDNLSHAILELLN